MLKPIIAALLLSTAVPAFAILEEVGNEEIAKASADPAGEKALGDVMSLFSKMFDTSDQPEPDAARLELAKVTAAKLLPNGAYSKIMDDMLGKMLNPLFDSITGLTDAQIVATTGVSEEAVAALSEEQKAAVAQIIDPSHKERGKQIIDVMKPIMTEAMAIIEPAIRTGMSRAYARKFSAPQLATINSFFTTPTGSAFAQESFALQADPEVMHATFQVYPTIIGSMMGDEDKFKAKFDALPKQRELKDLSETEMQQLAGLLGVEVKALEDHRTIATTVDPNADETGDEPWYAEDAWAATERKKVKSLEAKYDAAGTKSEAAYELLSAAYDAYRAARQTAVDAARKRMLTEGWTPPPAPSETTEDSADAAEAVAAL